MQFKGTGVGFAVDANDPSCFPSSGNYRFIHSNFDQWNDHLIGFEAGFNEKKVVSYFNPTESPKGEYTKTFFALNQLARNSFAESHGHGTPGQLTHAAALVKELALTLAACPVT